MKRSEINTYIEKALVLFSRSNYALPMWATYSPQEWRAKGKNCNEIKECALGWDITDFGKGNFEKEGLTLFTLRNGKPGEGEQRKTYCEKLMISYPGQITPMHFHWNKMEDIINRSGGQLAIQLWKASSDEQLSEEKFIVSIDGVERTLNPGEIIHLSPGESICLTPYLYHKFWAEGEACVIGEVSKVNDDNNDNRFYEALGRFPQVIEDHPAKYCLCNEYPDWQ